MMLLRRQQQRVTSLFAMLLLVVLSSLLLLLLPHTTQAYTPPPKTTAPRRPTTTTTTTTTRSSTNKRAPQSAAPPAQSKPPTTNPLTTLFQVYTRDTTPASPLSKEEAQLKKDRQYTLITGLPLKPYFERKTIRKQITPDIWTFEQPQGFFNVSTSIRMTVIRLSNGKLWVHAPIAATTECKRLLDEIGGEVAYLVLPTTAFEHKVYVRGFAKAYPKAKVYACPGQWSWPVNLPPPFRVDALLKDDDQTVPWAGEIEQALLQPPCIGIGPANEVVFYHRKSKTLIVTDLVVFIDGKNPSPVVEIPDLLKASLDDPDALPPDAPLPADTPANRQKGWARMALQILFLGPTKFSTFKLVEKRLLVSPVIETFVLSKVPEAVVEFVERVCERWPGFTSAIPAHFNAPAPATPKDLQKAFAFAYALTGKKPGVVKGGGGGGLLEGLFGAGGGVGKKGGAVTKYPDSDMEVLNLVNGFILKAGLAEK